MAQQTVTMATVADKALDKTTDLISMAADKATDIFSAASNILSKGVALYGQQAIDAVLWVVRIDAIQQIVSAVVALIFVGVVFYFINLSKSKCNLWNYWNSSDGFIILPIGVVNFVLGMVFFASILPPLTNIWLYTAIVKPELYLVKKTVDAVERKLGTQISPRNNNTVDKK